LDDQGNKIPLTTSRQGIVYSTTPFSSCTDEFKYRFEYFTLPPKVSNRKLAGIKSDTCPYYQTTQYRCAPFNQSTDLSGNYVIPGNKSLQTILKEEKTIKDNLDSSNKDINSDFITIAASVVILVGGVGGLLYVINNIASD
jgi:hypothetical protein